MPEHISQQEFREMKADVSNLKDATGRIETGQIKMNDTLQNFIMTVPKDVKSAVDDGRKFSWKLFGLLAIVVLTLAGWFVKHMGSTP